MTQEQIIQITNTTVSFISVILAGAVITSAVGAWLKNRREERAARIRVTEARVDELHERERDQWTSLLREKDGQIAALNNEILRLSRNYDIVSNILKLAEKKGEANE